MTLLKSNGQVSHKMSFKLNLSDDLSWLYYGQGHLILKEYQGIYDLIAARQGRVHSINITVIMFTLIIIGYHSTCQISPDFQDYYSYNPIVCSLEASR